MFHDMTCHFIKIKHGFCLAVILLAAGAMFASGRTEATDGVTLQPHRAVYSAELNGMETGTGIADVGGKMAVALEKTCDGWIMAQQMALDLTLANGLAARQQFRFAAWEALDGLSYRFAVREIAGQNETGFKGAAKLERAGGPGAATFEAPERKRIELPAGTVFPVSHTRHLIAAGREARKLDSRILFDGTSLEKPQKVTAFIGGLRATDKEGQTPALAARPGWPVRVAYFGLESKSETPEYEIQYLQLDNGVAREFVLDRGEFSLKFELDHIEAIDPPDC